jgi:hypothetical protein
MQRNLVASTICCLGIAIMWCGWHRVHSATPTTQASHTRALSRQVRKLVDMLRSSDPRIRASAQKELLEIEKVLVDTLLKHMSHKDERLRKRFQSVLREFRVATAACDTLAGLPKPRRDILMKFYRSSPHILRDMMSPEESQRLSVIWAIPRMDDNEGFTEELVWLGLNDSSPEVVRAAVRSIRPDKHKSKHIVEKLATFVVFGDEEDWLRLHLTEKDTPGPLVLEAAKQLEAIGDTSVLAALMFLAEKNFSFSDRLFRDTLVAQTVVSLGAKRAIPLLMERLSYRRGFRPRSWKIRRDGKTAYVTCISADQFLATLLTVTKQDMREYGLIPFPRFPRHPLPFYCFEGKEKRSAAFMKFRKWWLSNKSKPEYRDLKPIPTPIYDNAELKAFFEEMTRRKQPIPTHPADWRLSVTRRNNHEQCTDPELGQCVV